MESKGRKTIDIKSDQRELIDSKNDQYINVQSNFISTNVDRFEKYL